MQPTLASRKLALFVFFFIPGLALASWVTRTPDIRDAIQASIAQMGFVLSGLSVGSMSGVLLSGRVIQKRGTRFAMLLGLSLVCLSMLTMAWGVVSELQALVALGLAFFGFGTGMAEIAINMDAAAVEQASGKHVMHVLHGCFSLGTLMGALLGLAANALQLPVSIHLGGIFVISSLLLWRYCRHVPAGYGMQTDTAAASAQQQPQRSVWLDPRVQMIGLVVFAMALTEGAAYDWLPILLVDEHGFSASAGSLIFVVFAAMMTFGRFGGSILLRRFGRLVVVRASIVLAALGVACISLGHVQWLAGLAVMCWGMGAALGFPVALSAAAEGGAQMNERVKAVATIGYVALLVGPPALGFVGQMFGLRGAMLVVLAFVALALLVSRAMRSPQHVAVREAH
jgi:predicted MFS family arabinose efflux permease